MVATRAEEEKVFLQNMLLSLKLMQLEEEGGDGGEGVAIDCYDVK